MDGRRSGDFMGFVAGTPARRHVRGPDRHLRLAASERRKHFRADGPRSKMCNGCQIAALTAVALLLAGGLVGTVLLLHWEREADEVSSWVPYGADLIWRRVWFRERLAEEAWYFRLILGVLRQHVPARKIAL